MTPAARSGRGEAGIHPIPVVVKLLIACLGVVFLQACQPGFNNATVMSTTAVTLAISPSPVLPTSTASPTPTSEPTSESSLTATVTAVVPTETITPEPTSTTVPVVVFAAIGDYGTGNRDEGEVARLVLSWQPDFIITLGDNNYPSGAADHIDDAVGQFYHSYIYPYQGGYGSGSEVNRFFPSLGNHDLLTDKAEPYLDYFSLPGNERYYDFVWGPLHLYALNTIDSEPDGVGDSSVQAEWLKESLAASSSTWNIVYMHYPPYSSGTHGSIEWTRWPYAEWGADAVLAGHDHTYERLEVDGIPYFVNGLGGGGRYDFEDILDSSRVRYNSDYGAMRVEAEETNLVFEFITRDGGVVDHYDMRK